MNVIKKIDSPRNVKVFVSPTCPYCPQEAVNAVKAAIEKADIGITAQCKFCMCGFSKAIAKQAHG